MIVLSIGAHPDDETCASGTLIKYAEEGYDVYILMTTRGEGAQPANRQMGRLRQGQEQGIAALPSREAADRCGVKRAVPAQGSPSH